MTRPRAWLVAGGLAVVRHPGAAPRVGPGVAVAGVYPSGDVVPERLLRISIRFSRPPRPAVRGAVALRTVDGGALGATRLADALLPDALWSPDGTMLTLLFRPGRVKTGLRSHDERGWALVPGETVALSVGGHDVKRWRVAPGGCGPLNPAAWQVGAPRARTRDPLVVRLGAPVDVHAAAMIAVADERGARLAGRSLLADGERTWQLTPARPWRAGAYALRIHPRVETPCGDEVGDPFEHSATTATPHDPAPARPFVVREARPR